MPHNYNDKTGHLSHQDEKARILSLFPSQLAEDVSSGSNNALLKLIEEYYDSLHQIGQVATLEVETTGDTFSRSSEEDYLNIPATGGNGTGLTLNLGIFLNENSTLGKVINATVNYPGQNYYIDDIVQVKVGASNSIATLRVTGLRAGPSDIIGRLSTSRDLDASSDRFLRRIQQEIAKNVPASSYTDRRTLLKDIISFYKMKGSEASINTFFNIFFGTSVNVAYPNDITLKPSTGEISEIRKTNVVDINLEQAREFGTRRFDYVIPFRSITSSPSTTTPFRTSGSNSPILATPVATVVTRDKTTNGVYIDQSPDNVQSKTVNLSGFEVDPSQVEFNTVLRTFKDGQLFDNGTLPLPAVDYGLGPDLAGEGYVYRNWGKFIPFGKRDGKQRYFKHAASRGRWLIDSPSGDIFTFSQGFYYDNEEYSDTNKLSGWEISFNSPSNRWEYRFVYFTPQLNTTLQGLGKRRVSDVGDSPGHRILVNDATDFVLISYASNPNQFVDVESNYPTHIKEEDRWTKDTYLNTEDGLNYYYGFAANGIQISKPGINSAFAYDPNRVNRSTGTFINNTNQYLKILKLNTTNTAGVKTDKWAIVNTRNKYTELNNVTVAGGAKGTITTTNNIGTVQNFDFTFDGNYFKYSNFQDDGVHSASELPIYNYMGTRDFLEPRSGPEYWHNSPKTLTLTVKDATSWVRQVAGTNTGDYTLTVDGTLLNASPLHGTYNIQVNSSIYESTGPGTTFTNGRPINGYYFYRHSSCPSNFIEIDDNAGFTNNRARIAGGTTANGSPIHIDLAHNDNDFADWYFDSPTAMEVVFKRQRITLANASPAISAANQSYSPVGTYYEGIGRPDFYITKSDGDWKLKQKYIPSQIGVLGGNSLGEAVSTAIDGLYTLLDSPFNGNPVWDGPGNHRIYFSSARNRWELTDSPSVALATQPILFSDPPGNSPAVSEYDYLPPRAPRSFAGAFNSEGVGMTFNAPYRCFRTDASAAFAEGQVANVDLFWDSPAFTNYSPDVNIHSTGQTYGQRSYPEAQTGYTNSPSITRSGTFLHGKVSFTAERSEHLRITPFITNYALASDLDHETIGYYFGDDGTEFGGNVNTMTSDQQTLFKYHINAFVEQLSSPAVPYHLPYLDQEQNQYAYEPEGSAEFHIGSWGGGISGANVYAYDFKGGNGSKLAAFTSSTAGDYVPKNNYVNTSIANYQQTVTSGTSNINATGEGVPVTFTGASAITVTYDDITSDQSPDKIYFIDSASPSSTALFSQIDTVSFSPVAGFGQTVGSLKYANQSSPIAIGNSSVNTTIDSPVFTPREQSFTVFDYSPHLDINVAQDSPAINHSPGILVYTVTNAGVMNGTYEFSALSTSDTPRYINSDSPDKQIIINTKGVTLGSTGASNTPIAHLNVNGLGTRLVDTSASPNAGTIGKNSPFNSPTGLGNYFSSPSKVGAPLQFGGGITVTTKLTGVKSNVGLYPNRTTSLFEKRFSASSPRNNRTSEQLINKKEESVNTILKSNRMYSSDAVLSQFNLSKDDKYPHTTHLIHPIGAAGKKFGSACTLAKQQNFFVIAHEPTTISCFFNSPVSSNCPLTKTLNAGEQVVLAANKFKFDCPSASPTSGSPGDPSVGFINSTGLITVSTAAFDSPKDKPVGKSVLTPLHNNVFVKNAGGLKLVDENLNFYSPGSNIVNRFEIPDGVTGSPAPGRFFGAVLSDSPTSTNNYVAIDSNDGSGDDQVNGISKRSMTDTYVYGNSISDYTIISPYNNNVQVTFKLFNESPSTSNGEYVFNNHSLPITQFTVTNSSPDVVNVGQTNSSPKGADGTYTVQNAGTATEKWVQDHGSYEFILFRVTHTYTGSEYDGTAETKQTWYWQLQGKNNNQQDYLQFPTLPGTLPSSNCPQAVEGKHAFRSLPKPFESNWGSPTQAGNVFRAANFVQIPSSTQVYGNLNSPNYFQSPQKISVNSPSNFVPKLWKFKGRRPFQLIINNLNHEETQIGFNSNLYNQDVDSSERSATGRTVAYFDFAAEEVKRAIYNPSQLNDINRITDSQYYQNYSYEIFSTLPVDEWQEQYEQLVHPAGYKYWARKV